MASRFVPALLSSPPREAPGDPKAQAAGVWAAWGRGASAHTLAVRTADLASFGASVWRMSDVLHVIRRVIATLNDDSASLRALALRWIDGELARGMGPSTIARRWRTLRALLGAIARRFGSDPYDLGARPRVAIERLHAESVDEKIEALATAGKHRDAAIVGLLGELGLTDGAVLELRARDVSGLVCSPLLAAALARCTAGASPQSHAIRNPSGGALSSASLYAIVENEGTSVRALRRAAKGAT